MNDIKEKREIFISENTGLVHSCANRFRGRGVDYDDLFQAGCIGLIKAADNFDESRGYAFSTYAVPVILGEIKQVFRNGGSIKIGRAMKEKALKAVKEREIFIKKHEREPTISELSLILHTDACETAEILNAALPPISLTTDDESGGGQIDILTDTHEEKISDLIALSEVINMLPEEDKELIEARYFKGLTQSATAKELCMSQVQVSRKEKRILLQMRELLNK